MSNYIVTLVNDLHDQDSYMEVLTLGTQGFKQLMSHADDTVSHCLQLNCPFVEQVPERRRKRR